MADHVLYAEDAGPGASPPVRTVCVVGAGVSGASIVINLVRGLKQRLTHRLSSSTSEKEQQGEHLSSSACSPPLRVFLFDMTPDFGLGAAYRTPHHEHLLNVVAGGMSMFPDAPSDFVDWLTVHRPEFVASATNLHPDLPLRENYVPRKIYGEYIQFHLRQALDSLRTDPHGLGAAISVDLIQDEIVQATRRRSADGAGVGFSLLTRSGALYSCNILVLAHGNLPPRSLVQMPPTVFLANPWDYDVSFVQPHDSVLILGTGLTMVDTVLSLRLQGHVGQIYALSRRGLIPRAHLYDKSPRTSVDATSAAQASFLYDYVLLKDNLPKRLNDLVRYIRSEAERHMASGKNWRAVIQSLRFETQDIWMSLSLDDQRRFLRHVQPHWDVHRHRIAPDVGHQIKAEIENGTLKVLAGRIRSCDLTAAPSPNESPVVLVTAVLRSGSSPNELLPTDHADANDPDRTKAAPSSAVTELRVHKIINCIGPNADYSSVTESEFPLIHRMIADQMIRPDALRIGLDVTAMGLLLDPRTGNPQPDLLTMGSPCKGKLYETIAIPDLKHSSLKIAEHILDKFGCSLD